MTAETKPRRKKWKIAVSILLAVLVLLAGGFFWYVSDYYRAEDVALEVLASGEHLEVRDHLTILSPSYPTDTAIIFYPGAKVEAAAYLPLLNQLRQTGLTCILVEMPFHLAIFDVNAAEDVMSQFPDIRHWYIAGHSMGGAMASQFASEHPDEVDGLILLGAYSTATIRLPIPALPGLPAGGAPPWGTATARRRCRLSSTAQPRCVLRPPTAPVPPPGGSI
mgnify:CR=1 FL=1